MGLPDFAVKRPVTTIMIFVGMIILGVISWSRLPQELFPPITYPQLSVITNYENAAPEEVELLITRPIEEAVATVPGIKSINSTSKEGTSLVMAEFNWGTNMDFAALGMREKIDLVKGRLPRDCEEPIVMKFNPFELPILVLSVTGSESLQDLLSTTKKMLKDELEKIEGVAACNIAGGIEREILVEIDQGRLNVSGISLLSILDALNKSNMNYPAGTIKESFYEYLIRTMGEYQTIADIRDTVIEVEDKKEEALKEMNRLPEPDELEQIDKQEGLKRFISVSDVGRVKDTLKETTSISRYNGVDNISVSIQKQAGGFTLQVADKIKKALPTIKQNLPKNVKVKIVYDQSEFIRASINGVRDAALQGAALAFFVLLIFLKDIWLAVIVITITPITIFGCFSLMYFNGISLNMMSLGGMAIGVGMLTDNAIVIVDSIYRYKRQGMPTKEAAIVGSNEVIGPMIASTLTTTCVFFPMAFVVGIAGQLFKELAWVIIVTQVVSMIIAFMLIPCLVSQSKDKTPIVKKAENAQDQEEENVLLDLAPRNKFLEILGKPIDLIEIIYARLITGFMRHRFLYLFLILGVFFFSMKQFGGLDKEFMPKVDQGQFAIKVDLSPGTRLSVTDSVVKKVENLLLTDQTVEDITLNVGSSKERGKGEVLETLGSHQAQIMVNLKKEREMSTSDFIQSIKDRLSRMDLEHAEIQYIVQESALKTAFESSAPVVLDVKGTDLDMLRNLTESIQLRLRKTDGLYGIKNNLALPAPETKIQVLKDKASNYGLSVKDISATAQVALKGYIATRFKEEGKEVDIRVRLRPEDRKDLSKIGSIMLTSSSGTQLPLKEVTQITIGKGPSEIRRFNQQRTVLITANIYKRSLNEVQDEIYKLLKEIKIPKGYSITLTGEAEKMKESFQSLAFALTLAIILVYMIMAAQFESLWQPFLIMFTMPLSLIGIVWTLKLTGTALSVVVLLGVIMQGGIVVNNGIILIDYANILRGRGLSLYDATIKTGRTRLRPILMTALTSIFGLLPLALGLSEGSELDAPLAKTTMGGLLSSTFLSLVVVPALYFSSGKITERIFKKKTAVSQEAHLDTETAVGLPAGQYSSPEEKPEVPQPQAKSSHEISEEIIAEPVKPEKEIIFKQETPSEIKDSKEKIIPAETPPQKETLKPAIPSDVKSEKEKLPEPPISEREISADKEAPSQAGIIEQPAEPPQETTLQAKEKYIIPLNKRQLQALDYIKQHGRISRKEYADIFKTSVPTAARDLKDLVDRNLLIGRGPLAIGRYYELTK
ncbi:MAG: efflux RND transporter permease subunit [Candidatus Omnitrophota bacterium]